MPNQIPFNYYQSIPMPNLFEQNSLNEQNIFNKLNELEKRVKYLEDKINDHDNSNENNNYDYNFKTSMHMM